MLGKRLCLLLVLGCAALMMTSQLVAQTIRLSTNHSKCLVLSGLRPSTLVRKAMSLGAT